MIVEAQSLARRRYIETAASVEPVRIGEVVEQVLDDLALAGELIGPSEEASAKGKLVSLLSGFGILQKYLDDPNVEEVWINRPDEIRFAAGGHSHSEAVDLPHGEIVRLVDRMLRNSGRRIDRSQPFVDAELPDGSRFHCAIPDVTRSTYAVNIRKFSKQSRTLGQLVMLGVLSGEAADFLSSAIRGGKNLVVCGATQAGKTTMLAALLAELEAHERVITIEETFELKLANPDWVAMQTRPAAAEGLAEISMRKLVKESLRMRPNRIVIGEVREAECLDMLIALNSGVPGACTIHANSARDAVEKLCSLPLLAGPNISPDFIRQAVGRTIDFVLFCQMDADGNRRLSQILRLDWNPDTKAFDAVEVELC
jgi:pilus assembly protein CpaF